MLDTEIPTLQKSSYSAHNLQPVQNTVFIIDDDEAIRELLNAFYIEHGYKTFTFPSAEAAIDDLEHAAESPSLIICDLVLPNMSGLDLIEQLNAKFKGDIPVILITAHGSVELAITALKRGAFDYITKPLNLNELDVLSNRAIKIKQLERNYYDLRATVEETRRIGQMIGVSGKMKGVFELVEKVAETNSNVLIIGESGSGKEMVAKALHQKSKRANYKFVTINCAAIPPDLLEAELFGYKKGSFTGAIESRRGLFEEANKGTLFLDEIGDMSLGLQAKMLRVLQERQIRPLGENQDREIDVRIIAATHRDLKEAIKTKEFREDLYYRLCVIPIQVPPLRERREDIPILAMHFLKKYASINEKLIRGFTHEAIAKLNRFRWGGNVRELENAVERAVVLSTGPLVDENDLTLESSSEHDDKVSELFTQLKPLRQVEREYIEYVLAKTGGRKEEAAEILGINRKTLYRKERSESLN